MKPRYLLAIGILILFAVGYYLDNGESSITVNGKEYRNADNVVITNNNEMKQTINGETTITNSSNETIIKINGKRIN
jgi:hypothetical protein